MRYCNSGLKLDKPHSDVALLSTDGHRFEVRPIESEVVRDLMQLGAVSPRSLRKNVLVPFSSVTVRHLLSLDTVASCLEERDWLNLETVLEEICGYSNRYESIKSIRNSIGDHLLTTLSDGNCFLLHKKFRQFDCDEHALKTLDYIKYHLVRMVVVDKSVDVEFYRLPAEDLKALLQCDDVNVEFEDQIVQVVNQWIMVDAGNREKFRGLVMSAVRVLAVLEETAESLSTFQLSMEPARKTRDVMLVIGGWLHQRACDRIEWFDPELNQWHLSSLTIPQPLAYHGALFLDDFLYIFGGSNGRKTSCETWKVSPSGGWKWERCDNMMEPRNYISNSCVIFAGRIYVFGGQNWREVSRAEQRSRTAEVYDPKKNKWSAIASLHEMRSDCAAAVYDEQIFICGGFNGETLIPSVEVYNPMANFYTRLVSLPYALSGHSLVTHSDRLYVVGGFDGVARQKRMLVYEKRGEWHVHPEELILGRSTSSVCSYKGSVVVVGGYTSHVENTCETVLCVSDARFRSIPFIGTGKSALRVLVANNWRKHLEKIGVVESDGMDEELGTASAVSMGADSNDSHFE